MEVEVEVEVEKWVGHKAVAGVVGQLAWALRLWYESLQA